MDNPHLPADSVFVVVVVLVIVLDLLILSFPQRAPQWNGIEDDDEHDHDDERYSLPPRR